MTEKGRMEDFKKFAEGIFTDEQVEKLKEMGYFVKPASLKHHGQKEGGLYMHSKLVAMALQEFTKTMYLSWEKDRSPLLIGLMHDICKTDDYTMEEGKFVWNSKNLLDGHGDKSVIMALQLVPDLTDEEVMCIRHHMGAYEGQQSWEVLDNAIDKYPNILWVYQADMVVSKAWKI